jgi:hypothetical protein
MSYLPHLFEKNNRCTPHAFLEDLDERYARRSVLA